MPVNPYLLLIFSLFRQLYLELVTEISISPDYIARARHDGIAVDDGANPYDIAVEQYRTLVNRAESMIVKHVTAEVERDLRTHLTRLVDDSHHSRFLS
jgi:hypothetical protein